MKENSILNGLDFDRSTGSMTFKGVRYLLIRPETITSFQKALEEIKEGDAGEILYKGGFQGGYLSLKKYRETFDLSDREILEFMMNMGTEIGWGQLELEHYDSSSMELRISVMNSVFAEAYGPSNEGVCHLIRGVIGGMASLLFKQNCVTTEFKCTSKGDDCCVFFAKVKE